VFKEHIRDNPDWLKSGVLDLLEVFLITDVTIKQLEFLFRENTQLRNLLAHRRPRGRQIILNVMDFGIDLSKLVRDTAGSKFLFIPHSNFRHLCRGLPKVACRVHMFIPLTSYHRQKAVGSCCVYLG